LSNLKRQNTPTKYDGMLG